MRPESWQRTQQIYLTALEHNTSQRAGFLDQACDGDAALRHEVESLLAAHSEVGDFLLTPALALEAKALAAEQTLALAGQQLNQYQLISWLGAGGMGAVYLAQDSKLGRRVALKLLHARFTQDAEQARRFAREAKAASALSHPNIITIYDTGEAGETRFIAAEYIEGVTLRQRMNESRLELREALEIALQVAAALAAAHQAGIVHRDIKPENIMLRPDGLVKVLDFGLARITEPLLLAAAGQSAHSSETGVVVGTPRYMSPEQARGEKVGALTDIFSLGVVLYEMIAQQAPFTGATMAEVFAALLTKEPEPLSQHAAGVPAELQRIVSRALAKERAARYQSIQEMQADLQTQLAQLQQPGGPAAPSPPALAKRIRLPIQWRAWPRWRWAVALVLALLLLAGGVWQIRQRRAKSFESTLHSNLRFSTLPNMPVSDSWDDPSDLSFSPDGKLLAYSLYIGGESHLWIRPVDGGTPKEITQGKFQDYSPRWSPDGKELAFVSDRGGADGIWSVPYSGGTPKRLGQPESFSYLAGWSHNGQSIYFVANKKNLYKLDLATQQSSPVSQLKQSARGISVSPDEKQIAYIGYVDSQLHIWVAALDGSKARQVSSGPERLVGAPSWFPDGNRIAYLSRYANDVPQIYFLWLDGRAPVPITFGNEDYMGQTLSPDGTRMVATSLKASSNLFACDLQTGSETRHSSGLFHHLKPDLSPDGETIVYQAGESLHTWNFSLLTQSRVPGSRSHQLISNGMWAKWSPVEAKLAYVSNTFDLWKVSASGDNQQRLTTDVLVENRTFNKPYDPLGTFYGWSPDGKQIAYCSYKSGQQNIWIVASDGSSDVMVTHYTEQKRRFTSLFWSPDGTRLAHVSHLGGKQSIYLTEQGKTTTVYESDEALYLLGWSASGKELFVAQAKNNSWRPEGMSLVSVSLAGAKTRVIAHYPNAFLHNIRLSPDRRFIAYASRQAEKDNIEIAPTSGGPIRKLTNNSDPIIYYSGLAWAPDGKTLYYSKQTGWTQVSLIENLK